MHSNKKAQSTIEYAVMAVLVMLVILVVAPYVVRSINAYFKHSQDAIEESLGEDIQQGPITNPPIGACDCPGMAPSVCGDDIRCPSNTRVYELQCTPASCVDELRLQGVPTFECRDDADCCTPPSPTGNCGVNAVATPNPDHITDAFGTHCPDGTMEHKQFCGINLVLRYRCILHILCNFDCSAPSIYYDDWCDPPNHNVGLSAPSTAVRHYTGAGNCPGDPRCTAFCLPTFVAWPGEGGTTCRCPDPNSIILPDSPPCPPGSCGSNTCCHQGACPVNQCESLPPS